MTPTRLTAITLITLLAACSGGGTGSNPPVSGESGSVTGTVTASGSGVAGATIALPGSTAQTTDAAGKFTFENVKTGSYNLSVTLPAGYALGSGEAASKPVTVAAGQSATVNWALSRTAPIETLRVDLQATSFSPKDVTVSKGSTIHWVNATASTHTITADNSGQAGAWPSQTVSGSGTVFDHTFDATGTYTYHCTIHAGMTGTIKVQ
jgi:plastocyanin